MCVLFTFQEAYELLVLFLFSDISCLLLWLPIGMSHFYSVPTVAVRFMLKSLKPRLVLTPWCAFKSNQTHRETYLSCHAKRKALETSLNQSVV